MSIELYGLPERYLQKVAMGSPNDCWEWTGFRNRDGYGNFLWKGKYYKAHRFPALAAGYDIREAVVYHACDNPPCVNPRHLTVGTQYDNVWDMVRKGRATRNPLRGSASPLAKHTEDKVLAIRAAHAKLKRHPSGYLVKGQLLLLMERFAPITEGTLRQIIDHNGWKHI